MSETCGSVGFMGRNFAPTKRYDFSPEKMMRNWAEHRQKARIDKLSQKAETEGLSVQEKIDIAANKLDVALRNGAFTPTVMYNA